MPRQTLPAKISRNDKEPSTDAQAEAIGLIVDHYHEVDHLTEIADMSDYSRSHIGNVYRDYFEPATDKTKVELKREQNGVLGSDEVVFETPQGTFKCRSSDPEVRKAFTSALPELVA